MPRANNHFKMPQGFVFDQFTNERGQRIRFGAMKTQMKTSRGTLVLGPGYGEPTEKYFELIDDLTRAGYDIYIMDWMGQGGSERYDLQNPNKPYDVKNFLHHHREDLHHFTTQIIKVPSSHKLGYMGFSMGGHIGLRYSEKYDYIFDAMTLSAAMIDFNTGKIPQKSVGSLTQMFKMAGKGKDYLPGGSDWSELKKTFNDNKGTSDPRRFRNYIKMMAASKHLQLGDVTIDWMHHALPSTKFLNSKKTLAQIKTPILLLTPLKDAIVSPSAQSKAVRHLSNAQQITFTNAKHEIWIEKNFIRNAWMVQNLKFLNVLMKNDVTPPVRFSRKLVKYTPIKKPK